MAIKRIIIGIFASTFKGIAKFGSLFSGVGKLLKNASIFAGRLFFRTFLFPPYKLFYSIKSKISYFRQPTQSRLFSFLSHRYLMHVFVVIIGVTVIFDNLNAKEIRQENFGQNSLIYSIIAKEEYEELIEEMPIYPSGDKVFSYLDGTATTGAGNWEDSNQEGQKILGELSTTIEGGTAIVKPNVMQPVQQNELPVESGPIDREGVITYVVKAGDVISTIAGKFGVSVETILWENNLTARSIIREGMTLSILPVTGVSHTVKSGQSVGSIARTYGIDQEKIMSYNNLESSKLKIGQKLIIPGGRQIVGAVVKRPTSNTPNVAPLTKIFDTSPSPETGTATGFVWPAGARHITQYFTWRHSGLDVGGKTGTPIYAADDGVVLVSGWGTGYGYHVDIDHGGGYKTRYGHCSKLYVEKGQQVAKGETICAMGSTGWSTGPHLHFEVIYNGVKKNPLSYVK